MRETQVRQGQRDYGVEMEMEKETKQWDRRFINTVSEKERKSV